MINALYHAGTSTTIQFAGSPLRGQALTVKRVQSMAFDSDGAAYVYGKTTGSTHSQSLIFANVQQAVLDALLIFMQSRNGDKHTFTWYDHLAVTHTVRFDGGIDYTETARGKYKVQFNLFEDL